MINYIKKLLLTWLVDEPVIYTTKGHLPVKSLEYRNGWQEDDNAIFFWEEYWLGDEMVKRSAHGRMKKGLSMQSEIGKV